MSYHVVHYFLLYSFFSVYNIPTNPVFFFFFFNDTATTEIYTLPLHDALPICARRGKPAAASTRWCGGSITRTSRTPDRKSTRLNSSHGYISYAVFCLKKKKKKKSK